MWYCNCLIALLFITAACERQAETPTLTDIKVEDGPKQEAWGVHLYISHVPMGSEESSLRMEMIADYMAHHEDADSSYQELSGEGNGARVIVQIYDSQGDSSATVTADRVLYYDRENRFEARGNVIVTTREERRLETQILMWTEVERKIRTESFVRILTEEERMQGYGLEANEDLTSYQIGRFTARVNVESEPEE